MSLNVKKQNQIYPSLKFTWHVCNILPLKIMSHEAKYCNFICGASYQNRARCLNYNQKGNDDSWSFLNLKLRLLEI